MAQAQSFQQQFYRRTAFLFFFFLVFLAGREIRLELFGGSRKFGCELFESHGVNTYITII